MSDFPDLKGGSGSVSVEGVSKRYHLSGTRGLLRSLFFPRRDGGDDDLWALQDVSFSVQPGEAFGIIGHNGAGKSTMLKLLAGIRPVTRGRIDLRGRLAFLTSLPHLLARRRRIAQTRLVDEASAVALFQRPRLRFYLEALWRKVRGT